MVKKIDEHHWRQANASISMIYLIVEGFVALRCHDINGIHIIGRFEVELMGSMM